MKYDEKPKKTENTEYKITIEKVAHPAATGLEALIPTQIVLKMEKIKPECKGYENY